MMTRILALMVFFMGFSSIVEAKVYKIPKPLLQEARNLRQLVEAHPTSNKWQFELAMNYAYTGRIEKGWSALSSLPDSYADIVVTNYLKLSKEAPNEWRHSFKLAFGYYFKKQPKDAINSFKDVLKIDPNQVWAMGFIALILGKEGQNKQAVDWCQKALKIEKNAAAIHFLLAEAYRREGNYFGAIGEMMIVGRLKTEEAVVYKDEN
jgi:tetratricopeptide (TPR) repeat protein